MSSQVIINGKLYTIYEIVNRDFPQIQILPNYHQEMRKKEKISRESSWKQMSRFNYKKH